MSEQDTSAGQRLAPRPSKGVEASADGLPTPRRYWAIAAIVAALAMTVLDSGIVNVALPSMAQRMGATPTQILWVVNGYLLAVVTCLLPSSALGEAIGFRRVFLSGVALFTAGSLACALAPSLPVLIAARVAQGIGGAAVMSLVSGMIRNTYPAAMLGRAIGINSLVVGVSVASGPAIGAAILSSASWPWLFALNVPIGLTVLALGLAFLPQPPPRPGSFDPLAAVLNIAMFGLLAPGLEAMGERPAVGAAAIAAAALAFVLMLRRQAGRPTPMLPLDLLRIPVIGYATAGSMLCFAAVTGGYVALPFYLQAELGYSPLEVGALITPMAVATAVMGPIAGRLSDHLPPSLLAGTGAAAYAVGIFYITLLPPGAPGMAIGAGMLLCGIGFGLFQTPNNRAMLAAAPRARAGASGGLQATARVLGHSLGVTSLALCFHGLGAAGPHAALMIAAGSAAAAALVSAAGARSVRARNPGGGAGV